METKVRVARIVWTVGNQPVWEANDGPLIVWKGSEPFEYEVWSAYCLTELLR